MKDNRSYYDDFSSWYERGRGQGYHAYLDQSQLRLLAPHIQHASVCEIGCGTGLILKEVAPHARDCVGIDLSRKMLGPARERNLKVAQSTATQLPFSDAVFDLVYSFKVLPHVEEIERALDEVARILKPGGKGFLEFYNPNSIRSLIKRLKKPHAISEETDDTEVFTRYDDLDQALSYLPDELEFVQAHGIRVVTPSALLHRLPLVKSMVQWTESRAQNSFLGPRFGGFLVLEVARR